MTKTITKNVLRMYLLHFVTRFHDSENIKAKCLFDVCLLRMCSNTDV